jgi:hypothetical protein
VTRASRSARTATAVAIALALALPAIAGAATLRVRSTAEQGPGSLGATIAEAGPGDTIRIPPGRYLLTNGDVLVAQQNTLVGAGAGATTIVPSGGGEALEQVTVRGATIDEPLNPTGEDDDGIGTRAQIVALVATIAIFLLILELVRRRRLVERYALLWMLAAVALLVLAIWTDLLAEIADAMGIAEPANAIFILAFGVAFVLLLHFSVATSRLGEETKILAQEVARLEHEVRTVRGELPSGNGAPAERGGSAATGAEDGEGKRPVRPERPRQ